MDKKFIIRLIAFIMISVGVPIAYLIIKFDMFQQATRFGMAELLCVLIVISLGVVLLKYYVSGMKTKYSYLKQIIMGIIKTIIPLLAILIVIVWCHNNIEILEEFLFIVIPSEFIAIFVNPLPKWAFENNIDGLSEIATKIFDKGGKE